MASLNINASARSDRLLAIIEPQNIAMFRFLLETYENLAYFTVLDRKKALLKIVFAPESRKTVIRALSAINRGAPHKIMTWPNFEHAQKKETIMPEENELKTPVLLIGAGSFCKSVIDALTDTYWTPMGVVENDKRIGDVSGVPVLGDESRLGALKNECETAIITVDYHVSQRVRKYLFQILKKLGFVLPVIKAASARVSPSAILGEGCLLMPEALVGPDCKLGANCALDTRALVKTDAWLGDDVFVGAGAILGDGCVIERGARLGDGALVAPKVVVGKRAWLAAGVVARKDVPAYKITRADT